MKRKERKKDGEPSEQSQQKKRDQSTIGAIKRKRKVVTPRALGEAAAGSKVAKNRIYCRGVAHTT